MWDLESGVCAGTLALPGSAAGSQVRAGEREGKWEGGGDFRAGSMRRGVVGEGGVRR